MRDGQLLREKKPLRHYWRFVSLCFLMIPLPLLASFRVFVFNPESQVSRARFVKVIFEEVCRKVGIPCSMQIFAKSIDFEKVTNVKKPEFGVVASYYYVFHRSKFRWTPLFSGYRARRSGFKKALLSKGKSLRKIKYISTVSIGGGSINPVERRFIRSVGRGKMFITKVSKEIDAIMGLALSQVDGAIVSMKALKMLRRINPGAASSLKRVKILPTIQYPKIVFFPGVRSKALQEMKTVLSVLAKDKKKGRLFFTYFGVTQFR